jgi:D-alanyl-D-alanine dipeptidase
MMKTMPFPREYKKHLQRGRKDTTIRIQKEVGKYRRGKTYDATDYKGNPFDIEIKVLDVIYTPFKKVRKHIPDAELNRPEFKKMKEDDKVNIIKFKSRMKLEPVSVKDYGLKADEGKPRLNKKTAEALKKANSDLPKGYDFSIINGYRSMKEQKKIVEDMEKKLKKTNPHNWKELLKKYTGGYEELYSKDISFMDHRSGNAVDLKIVHGDEEVELGGEQMDERDRLDYYEKKTSLTKEEAVIRHNRRWLKKVLERHGFKNNPDEWWHWGYKPKW